MPDNSRADDAKRPDVAQQTYLWKLVNRFQGPEQSKGMGVLTRLWSDKFVKLARVAEVSIPGEVQVKLCRYCNSPFRFTTTATSSSSPARIRLASHFTRSRARMNQTSRKLKRSKHSLDSSNDIKASLPSTLLVIQCQECHKESQIQIQSRDEMASLRTKRRTKPVTLPWAINTSSSQPPKAKKRKRSQPAVILGQTNSQQGFKISKSQAMQLGAELAVSKLIENSTGSSDGQSISTNQKCISESRISSTSEAATTPGMTLLEELEAAKKAAKKKRKKEKSKSTSNSNASSRPDWFSF